MRSVLAILLLAVGPALAACGEKIAIPEAQGVPSSGDYNEVGQWDLTDPVDAIGADGFIFVVEGQPGSLAKYNGRFLLTEGPVVGLLNPIAICYDEEADRDRRIIVGENGDGANGPRLSFFGQADLAPAGSYDLSGLVKSIASVVTRGDSLYIADPDSGAVLRFVWLDHNAGLLEPRGEVCNSRGSDESPQFVQRPAGLAFDAEGYLLVSDADTTRNWVIRFDPEPLRTDSTGVFVPFQPNDCASLNLSASVIGKAPGCAEPFDDRSPGSGNGEFHTPFGLGVDAKGRIYVADSMNGRGQRFEADGTFTLFFGSGAGGSAALIQPVKLIVVDWEGPCGLGGTGSYPGGLLYVVDAGTGQIRVFEDARVTDCNSR